MRVFAVHSDPVKQEVRLNVDLIVTLRLSPKDAKSIGEQLVKAGENVEKVVKERKEAAKKAAKVDE